MSNTSDYYIITGASSGIGLSTTKFLAKKGLQIIATARKVEDIAHLDSIANVRSVFLDVRDQNSIDKLVEFIEDKNLKIKGLINNAGILDIGLVVAKPVEIMEEIFDVNVFGVHRITQAILPFLLETKGHLLFISSDSGLITFRYNTIYCMTKHAIESYAEGLRDELKKHPVSISLIEPGNVKSEIVRTAVNRLDDEIPLLFENEVSELIESLRQSIGSFDNSRSADNVAKIIHEALTGKKPLFRYLVTDRQETKRTISVLLDKTISVNKSSKFQLSDGEINNRIEFAKNL
ncbi:MAG: SDR family NAD(P)-dependent oxidoreductase [Candidatus Kariarchaeaceae archaeon]